MPRRKIKRGPPMSDAAKQSLAVSDRGSYYNQSQWINELDRTESEVEDEKVSSKPLMQSASARKLLS